MKLSVEGNENNRFCFLRYEGIREKGRYNMVMEADQAMKAAGLTNDEYWFVVKNYDQLKQRYGV